MKSMKINQFGRKDVPVNSLSQYGRQIIWHCQSITGVVDIWPIWRQTGIFYFYNTRRQVKNKEGTITEYCEDLELKIQARRKFTFLEE